MLSFEKADFPKGLKINANVSEGENTQFLAQNKNVFYTGEIQKFTR